MSFGRQAPDAYDQHLRDGFAPRTAAELNRASLDAQHAQQGSPHRGPVAYAARLAEAVHQHAQAVAEEQALVERHAAARDLLLKLGSDAQVQAVYERALAEGRPTAAPLVASRAEQQARVNGLSTMAAEAGAKVAHRARVVSISRKDLVQALLADALLAYEAQCQAIISALADVAVISEQCGQNVVPGVSRFCLPSYEGGAAPGGPGARAIYENLHDSGERARAAERIDAEIARLLQIVRRVEQEQAPAAEVAA